MDSLELDGNRYRLASTWIGPAYPGSRVVKEIKTYLPVEPQAEISVNVSPTYSAVDLKRALARCMRRLAT